MAAAARPVRVRCPLCSAEASCAPGEASPAWITCGACGLRYAVEATQPAGGRPSGGVAVGEPPRRTDFDRWLAGEPIRPRTLSPGERLARLCRRRPYLTALAATIVTLVVGAAALSAVGLAYTSWRLEDVERRRAVAELQRQEAESEAAHRARLAAQRQLEAQRAEAERLAAEQRAAEAQRRYREAEEQRQLAERQRAEAERNARTALAHQLAADSRQLLATQPHSSLFLAGESLRAKLREGLGADRHTEQLLRDALALVGVPALSGHTGPIRALTLSPDGQRLVTAGADRAVRVWDLSADGRPPRVLLGHRDGVSAAVILPGGKSLVTAGSDGLVLLWDLAEDAAAEPPALIADDCRLVALATSPDGRWLLGGGAEAANAARSGAVRLWRLEGDRPVGPPIALRGHDKPILAVTVTPDDRWAVSAGEDNTVRLWNLAGRHPAVEQVVFRGHAGWVGTLAVTPDARCLVSGSYDGTVRIWDLHNPSPSQEAVVLRGHQGWIAALAVNRQGTRLASGSFDRTVRVWNLEATDPETQPMVLRGHAGRIQALAFTPCGNWLVSAGFDTTARIWNLASPGEEVESVVLRGHAGPIEALALSADGRWLFTAAGETPAAKDNNVRVWDLRLETLLENAHYVAAHRLSQRQREQLLLESARRSEQPSGL